MGIVRDEGAQATVEAACLIPVVFTLLLMLIQPGIILYDRMVMGAAASEACRLLATKTSSAGDMQAACEAFVRHRLGAVPQTECFHMHEGGCSWDIRLEGDEGSSQVRACIGNRVKLLPLISLGTGLLGLSDGNGCLYFEVERQQSTQPDWVASSELGLNPSSWVGAWLE